ncbi:MAG: insulinase family protein [Acidobacteria bacterium]|nr:insulinase family protein [Acidobacteriota bacterium]
MRKRIFSFLFIVLLTAQTAFAQSGGIKLPPYKKAKLKNGLTIILMEQHEVPLVSFSVLVKAGATADAAGKEGTAAMVAGLLRKGTKTRTGDQISNDLDFTGAQLGFGDGADFTTGRAEFVKKDLAKGLDIFADCLLAPMFPADEFIKLQKQTLDGLKAAKDQAQGVIGEYYNAYLFGSAHPYGRNATEASAAALTRDDVAKFYETYYTPSNTILSVVGDFATAEMEKLLEAKFGAWPAKNAPTVNVPDAAAFTGKKLLLIDKPDSTQTYYRIGNLGVARTNKDRIQINVINTLFGGRFTSMLNDALRVSSGLTYGANSFFDQRKARGSFAIATYTRNETTEKAIDLTLKILDQLHAEGISEKDLQSGKNYLKGQFPPTIETNDQLAAQLASFEFYGLDASDLNDFAQTVDAMTLADAQRIIKTYFPKENLVFVLIGKASEIETAVKKYAPKLEKKAITDAGY